MMRYMVPRHLKVIVTATMEKCCRCYIRRRASPLCCSRCRTSNSESWHATESSTRLFVVITASHEPPPIGPDAAPPTDWGWQARGAGGITGGMARMDNMALHTRVVTYHDIRTVTFIAIDEYIQHRRPAHCLDAYRDIAMATGRPVLEGRIFTRLTESYH